jgi:hypothetical protein
MPKIKNKKLFNNKLKKLKKGANEDDKRWSKNFKKRKNKGNPIKKIVNNPSLF